MSLVDADARRRIATDTSSTLFVEAGAGSGKTKSLVDRVETLVVDDGLALTKIAAVTFTEKAGAELRDRLRERLEKRLSTETDETRQDAARSALDELDVAAFGTLHSFAQRILTMFPIQAGIPPLLEVRDEVASSIGFDERWASLRRELLDADDVADSVMLVLSQIKPDDMRPIVRALGNDWDLIEERILAREREPLPTVDLSDLALEALTLAGESGTCSDPSDKFVEKLEALRAWGKAAQAAENDLERYAQFASAAYLKFTYGQKAKWPNLQGLKDRCTDLQDRIAARWANLAEKALRNVTWWLAGRVLDAASARRADGDLEFHDLLVLARDLVRRDAGVRAELQSAFPRILLDEFQDTDPIQVELAVRISAGVDGGAADWTSIDVPPGSLFVVGDPKQSIYRFRRANIGTYLTAQSLLGETVALTTNFRTVAPILDWVNGVFAEVIVEHEGAQPAYRALDPEPRVRTVLSGPAVVTLGAVEAAEKLTAGELREREARGVAAAISTALAEGWSVYDRETSAWRPVRPRDIAVLVPARTSLPFLEDAFEDARLAYRAEASSLVYQAPEIRDLMAAARAVADTADRLSLVTALRSPLYGCGDDDLWTYVRDGGVLRLGGDIPAQLAGHPVAAAITHLRHIRSIARWGAPSDVLEAIVVDRRQWEVAHIADGPRARDHWRRSRFVIDQARAWADVQKGGLREYLAWAARQADDSTRVAEAVLPESDVEAVKIMTVHAAKGLEFPMVVLSGMTAAPRRTDSVRLLWTADGYEVKLKRGLQTAEFDRAEPIDEQMDAFERRRLLYVAATRARDHLVVSLHRHVGGPETNARILAEAGASGRALALTLEPVAGATSPASGDPIAPPEPYEEWSARVGAARAASRRVAVRSASGLEGTEPEIALTPVESDDAAGAAKGARDLELPPWLSGRYGSKVGRAVHGVLQRLDVVTEDRLESSAASQAIAEGVPDQVADVVGFVRSALAAPLVKDALDGEHWREAIVGTIDDEGILEGIIDLLFRRPDGSLGVIDYKTDAVPDAALDARVSYYRPQLEAYRRAVAAATGVVPDTYLAFLAADGSPARVRELA
jgi:ATP-dependent helicase/nuclease subunit A